MSFLEANRLGSKREPFLIISNFDSSEVSIHPLSTLKDEDIEFQIEENIDLQRNIEYKKEPISFKSYEKKFDRVIDSIKKGYTYILNLTSETPIEVDSNLKELYSYAKAKYKLRFKDKFICYSPETFVNIENSIISAYPMKGTLDASIPDGESILLNSSKEDAEHIMIVDLLRNDLNMVSSGVRVEKFKSIEKIKSGDRELLQMSSKISGDLSDDWHNNIGTILKTLLPAGSITGTPKKRTVELINEIEDYDRGFFTGIFGIYDGKSFKSSVMIRFIENRDGKLYYKSGGGITLDSDSQSEYRELIDKVYLF